jgi:hypothetical protein
MFDKRNGMQGEFYNKEKMERILKGYKIVLC